MIRTDVRFMSLSWVMGLLAGATVGATAGSIMAMRTVARNIIGLTLDGLMIGIYLGLIYGAVWAAAGLLCGLAFVIAARWIKQVTLLRVYAASFGIALAIYLFLTCMRLYNEDLYFYKYSFINSLQAMRIFFAIRTIAITAVAMAAGYVNYRLLKSRPKAFLISLFLVIAFSGVIVGLGNRESEQMTAMRLPPAREVIAAPPIVLIGWDGATWVIMDRMISEGRMPNVTHLITNGARANLKTLSHTVSPEIWTTIYTGKGKAQHGICGFDYYLIPGIRRAVVPPERGLGIARLIAFALRHKWIDVVVANRSLRRSTPIWCIMNQMGRTAGVVGALVTWPAEEIEPFLITSIAGDVADRIRRGIVGPEALRKEEVFYPSDFDETAIEMILENKRWETKVGPYLYEQYRPYLFITYTNQPDGVQHLYWKWMEPQYYSDVTEADVARYGDVIENEYVFLDSILGEYLEIAGDSTTIMIVSDHGFSPTYRSLQQAGHYHGPDGIFIACGPPIKAGIELENATVFDIAPTILALAGLPVPEDMEGTVLQEMIVPEFLATHPIRKILTYETRRLTGAVRKSGVEKDIRRKLKALGYIAH